MDEQWDWLYRECGQLLASKRKQVKLTQGELAERLDMSRASVANIEAGKQRMQLHLLFRISRLLDVSPYELIPSLAASKTSNSSASTPPLRMSDELLVRRILENEPALLR